MRALIAAEAVLDGLAGLAAVRTAVPRPGPRRPRASALQVEQPEHGGQAVIRDEIEALVARERPGWRVVDVMEINDESGPSFEVVIVGGDDRVTVLVSADERIVGERR